MSKKILMPEILPDPGAPRLRSSPRERAEARMRRLLSVASLGLAACTGYGVVDPMPEPAEQGADAEKTKVIPDKVKREVEPPPLDPGYGVVDPIPEPALREDLSRPRRQGNGADCQDRSDVAPPPAMLRTRTKAERGGIRVTVEADFTGVQLGTIVRAKSAEVLEVKGSSVLVKPWADVFELQMYLTCGDTYDVTLEMIRVGDSDEYKGTFR